MSGQRARTTLDAIVARVPASLPRYVTTLRLPKIEGWEEGHVLGEWTVDPDVLSDYGTVFGGYLADNYIALATLTTLADDEILQTTDLHISFLRPARSGSVRCEATVAHRGRRRAHVEATLTDSENYLVAKATATQFIETTHVPG